MVEEEYVEQVKISEEHKKMLAQFDKEFYDYADKQYKANLVRQRKYNEAYWEKHYKKGADKHEDFLKSQRKYYATHIKGNIDRYNAKLAYNRAYSKTHKRNRRK